MKFAYADPPYIGCAKRHYKDQPDYAGEVDHKALLEQLYHDFPDGWALSSHPRGLWDLLPMIPKSWKCRIAAWCKPFGTIGASGTPMNCWEPVIFRGGRERKRGNGLIADFLVTNGFYARIGNLGTKQRRVLPGVKPDEFCYWIFELLYMQSGDEFVDLFPGTGRVARAWKRYQEADVALFIDQDPPERSGRREKL